MPFDHRIMHFGPHCLSLNIQVRKNPYDVVPKHPVSSNMGLGKQFAVAFKFRYFYIYYPCRSVSHNRDTRKPIYRLSFIVCFHPFFGSHLVTKHSQHLQPAFLPVSQPLRHWPSIRQLRFCLQTFAKWALRPPLLYTGPYFLPV